MAVYTMFLGIRIFINAFRKNKPQKKFKHYGWLAGAGGFLDSFGGGGWGPIVTTTLITKGRSPKYVIGSVSLTEFFVTLASAFTFFTMLGVSHWQTILALIIGGLIAAPLAAKLAGRLPRKASFISAGYTGDDLEHQDTDQIYFLASFLAINLFPSLPILHIARRFSWH